jgi:ubiquinone biosynthesis protein COQ9
MSDAAARARQETRDRLLEAALPHVIFDGWGLAALKAGAANIGMTAGQIHAVFISPEQDLLSHFSDWADRRMLLALSEMDLPSMKVRARITGVVRARLEALAGNEEAVRRAAGTLALPGHTGLALRDGYRTVDAIWRVAGDEATDFNFYTKRGLLAAVLVSTTLFWLDDSSDEHGATWAFLDRRIEGIMRIPKFEGAVRSKLEQLQFSLDHIRRRRSSFDILSACRLRWP